MGKRYIVREEQNVRDVLEQDNILFGSQTKIGSFWSYDPNKPDSAWCPIHKKTESNVWIKYGAGWCNECFNASNHGEYSFEYSLRQTGSDSSHRWSVYVIER